MRRLTFGDESQHVSHLGYYLAGWNVSNYPGLGKDTLMYNVPGKLASVGPDHHNSARASTLFIFASDRIDYDRGDIRQEKEY